MRKLLFSLILLTAVFSFVEAKVRVGIGIEDITPPVGTPAAGYGKREGKGMVGTHDPLLASALYIDNGSKQIVICSVDNLGFDSGMIQEIRALVKDQFESNTPDIFISSSHTHSGGGAFIDFPFIGKKLAGKYDPNIRALYIQKTANAIIKSMSDLQEAKVGLSITTVPGLSSYRSSYPENLQPIDQLFILKVTTLADEPLAVIFNFALHPTTLLHDQWLFSSDFVGASRQYISDKLGSSCSSLFINGAQAEILPARDTTDEWRLCEETGQKLGEAVVDLWQSTTTSEELSVETQIIPYAFKVSPPLFWGWRIPIKTHESEVGIIQLNNDHAILSVPGELSIVYDEKLQTLGKSLGFSSVSIFGLTNDAHGYIITPEAIEHETKESYLSLGDKNYGERVYNMFVDLLKSHAPYKNSQDIP